MLESIFTFLFKYRPLVFQRGDLTLAAPAWGWVLAAGALAAAALLTYARAGGRAGTRDRLLLGGLRLALLALLALCLLRPTLVVPRVVPQENFVAVLVDDSRSMRIADGGEEARGETARRMFLDAGSPLLGALADRFVLRFYRFSDDARRADPAEEAGFRGTRTLLGPALDRVRADLAGVPLSGVVLVSDGADNARTGLAESLLALRAASVPVYAVGLGREELSRDIQVSRVEVPRRVLRGSSLVIDVGVTQRGYAGRTVPLQVEDGGRIIAARDVELPADGEPATVRVRFDAEEAGPRRLRFRIPLQEGEMVEQNNARDALMEVRNGREKILYFEGEPRFEVKFLRRAVAEDENLQVVVLQRTADGKYLRLDVDDADELMGGFPRTREELFAYRGLILGSVEASAFTHDQLRMIAEFVGDRGGGLLLLGGRRALAEGGWAGTPVAEVLPVALEEPAAADELVEVAVRPTRAGAVHPVTQLAGDEEASRERWSELPAVTAVNRVGAPKPAATVLLAGNARGADDTPVLAFQRYGRGKAVVLPVQDTWIWQMHAEVPLEDLSHETLWRQLLRWLVDGVPDRVVAEAGPERVEPGEAATLLAAVEDSGFLRVNGARVEARVTTPTGAEATVPLEWTVERDGEYRARFTPDHEGIYEVRVSARNGETPLGEDVTYLRAQPSDAEYFDAGMRSSLLRRVAEETGGRFYSAESAATLPEDISLTGAGITMREELDLWDMPIVFLLLLGLLGAEWALRRKRGLP